MNTRKDSDEKDIAIQKCSYLHLGDNEREEEQRSAEVRKSDSDGNAIGRLWDRARIKATRPAISYHNHHLL